MHAHWALRPQAWMQAKARAGLCAPVHAPSVVGDTDSFCGTRRARPREVSSLKKQAGLSWGFGLYVTS